MSVEQNIAIVGAGHLATALVQGLLASGTEASSILLTSPEGRSSAAVKARFGTQAAADNSQAAQFADTVLIAVRPPQVQAVLRELSPHLREHSVVSLAAGWECRQLAELLPEQTAVCRAMPNLGIAHNVGFTGLCCAGDDSRRGSGQDSRWAEDAERRRRVTQLFGRVGEVAWIDEQQMDALTAVAGCGPGFVFEFAQSLKTAAQDLGLDGEQTQAMVASVLRTCAELLRADADVAAWRDKVAVEGGMTEAGLRQLQQDQLSATVAAAVRAAAARALELRRQN